MTCTDYERDKRNSAIILAVLLIVTLTLFFVSMCVGRYSVSLKSELPCGRNAGYQRFS